MIVVLDAAFVKSASKSAEWPPPSAPEIAFCGRSNVGKSSLLNALAGRKGLARVSNTPGRTRLLNFFTLQIAQKTRNGRRAARPIALCDLPGYGYAKGSFAEVKQFGPLVESYLTQRAELGVIALLVDGEIGPQPSDQQMFEWLAAQSGKPVIVAATKLDRLGVTRRKQQIERIAATMNIAPEHCFGVSARDRIGLDELWEVLLENCESRA